MAPQAWKVLCRCLESRTPAVLVTRLFALPASYQWVASASKVGARLTMRVAALLGARVLLVLRAGVTRALEPCTSPSRTGRVQVASQ